MSHSHHGVPIKKLLLISGGALATLALLAIRGSAHDQGTSGASLAYAGPTAAGKSGGGYHGGGYKRKTILPNPIAGEALDEANGGFTLRGTPVTQRTPECFPAEPRDLFWKMDQVPGPDGKLQPLNFDENGDGVIDNSERDAIRGRNTWVLWGGGNESFWNWLQQDGYGLTDFLILMDSRQRESRFKRAGLINQPGFQTSTQRFLGLYIDQGKPNGEALLLPPGAKPPANYNYSYDLSIPETVDAQGRLLPEPVTRPTIPANHQIKELFEPWTTPEKRAEEWKKKKMPGEDPYKNYVPEVVHQWMPKDGLDANIYGYPSGIFGLRLLLNPDFFAKTDDAEKARAYWKERVENTNDRYYSDPTINSDPTLIRPFRVTMSCGFCHVAPHPLSPPADVENPGWENLSSVIGAQYWDPQGAIGNLLKRPNFLYHFLKSQAPGTVDTSLVSTDQINNTNVMNAIFDVPARITRALNKPTEEQSRENLLLPSIEDPGSTSNQRHFPMVLFPGEDSVGVFGALARVPLNIGVFSEQWARCDNPAIGFSPQRPFRIEVGRANSVYFNVNEKYRVGYMAKFFLLGSSLKVSKSTAAMKLKDAQVNAGPKDNAARPPFTKDDILGLGELVEQLQQKGNAVSKYLVGRFSPGTQALLADPKTPLDKLNEPLAKELEAIIAGTSLLAPPGAPPTNPPGADAPPAPPAQPPPPSPFASVSQPMLVKGMAASKLDAGETAKLNWLLLDAAYPGLLRTSGVQMSGQNAVAYVLAADSPEKRKYGRELFLDNCAICHSSKQPDGLTLAFTREMAGGWHEAQPPAQGKPLVFTLPQEYGNWDTYKTSPSYAQFKKLIRGVVKQEAEKAIFEGVKPGVTPPAGPELEGRVKAFLDADPLKEEHPFFVNNFLSTELRVPVTLVGTYAGRSLATNATRGNVWDNYSSETFKNLPSVGKIQYYNPYLDPKKAQPDPIYGTNADFTDGRVKGGPGYFRPASLISVWATAPYFHNNTLGLYNQDPSIRGRISAFEDGIRKLLWKDERPNHTRFGTTFAHPGDLRIEGSSAAKGDPGYIYRLPVDTFVTFQPGFIRPLIENLLIGFVGIGPGQFIFTILSFWWWVILAVIFAIFTFRGRARQAGVLLLLLALALAAVLLLTGLGGAGGTMIGAVMMTMTNLLGYADVKLWLIVIAIAIFGMVLLLTRREWVIVARSIFLIATLGTLFVGILLNKYLTGHLKEVNPVLAVLPNSWLNGPYKGIHIGPIPRGTPVNLLMNIDPEKRDKLPAALIALLRASLTVEQQKLTGEQAYKVFADKAGAALLEASKCPDMVLDRGHYFGETLDPDPKRNDEAKEALISFLKTL